MNIKENYLLLLKIKDQTMLAKYYSLADVFVICSKRENFPTTCVEAQCCGVPVVGFDTGGTKETSIRSERDFVEYGKIAQLKDVILDVLGQKRTEIALEAKKEYSNEIMAKRYMELYDQDGKKNRVLLIDVNCKHSSTGKIVYELFDRIRRDGRSAAVCYGRGERIKEQGIYKFGIDWETNVHALLTRITGLNGCFSAFSTRRLIRYIEEYQPDMIHIHELHAYFVNLKPLLRYIKKKRIPVVWTFHCEYMYTGKCGHAYECLGFQKSCGNCPSVHDYPKSLFLDQTKRMLHWKKELLSDMDLHIVTPSKWLANRVQMSFLKDKQISVIHNGIDTSVFHPVDACDLREQLNIPKDYKVVLAIAPDIMSEQKGGKWVLQLAELMKDEKVMFVLVGA